MNLEPDNTFVVSDFHFDHKNIIKYCNRPFENVDVMNHHIITNLMLDIKPTNTLLFLGDIAFGRESRTPSWWLEWLKEHITPNIIYIKGSHDNGIRPTNTENCFGFLEMTLEGKRILFKHEPYWCSSPRPDWIVHGHTHKAQMLSAYSWHRICVCVEATNYKPVLLQSILDLIKEADQRENVVGSVDKQQG